MIKEWMEEAVGAKIFALREQSRLDGAAHRVEMMLVEGDHSVDLYLTSTAPIEVTCEDNRNRLKNPAHSDWMPTKFAVYQPGSDEPARRLFLKLWDAAKDCANYSKKDWLRLAVVLERAGYL